MELLVYVFCLLMISTVMIYSASIALADSPKYEVTQTHFFIRHLLFVLVGGIAGVIASRIPMRYWFKYAPIVGIVAIVLIIAVLIPGVGKEVNGAKRWIALPLVNLQVSEVMKVAAIIIAAAFTVKMQEFMHSFSKGFFPMALVMSVVSFLIMMQPDLGATVVIVAEIMGVLFLGGLNLGIFAFVLGVVAFLIAWMIFDTPWRLGRVLAYMDPWDPAHVQDKAYQLAHSLIAFGRGEFSGVGLGASVEKLNYLPEAHTDFIAAVIAEELGFVGVAGIILIYYLFIRRAFEIGRQAIKMEQYFSGLVAQGVGVWFGVQVVINVGVASGLLPTKGLTLPLISYGGSALVLGLFTVGILWRVNIENQKLMRGEQV